MNTLCKGLIQLMQASIVTEPHANSSSSGRSWTIEPPGAFRNLLLCHSDNIDGDGIELKSLVSNFMLMDNEDKNNLPLSSSINPLCHHLHPAVLSPMSA